MRRAGVLASSRCMMSFSRRSEALFWMTRLARLSPLVITAPFSTNFSPGFSDSFSGMGDSLRRQDPSAVWLTKTLHWKARLLRGIKHDRALMHRFEGVFPWHNL